MLFDGVMHVFYGQVWLVDDEDLESPFDGAFDSHTNGLAGAAVPGVLALHTAMNHGTVHLRIEHHDGEPALGSGWEEAVEVSFHHLSPTLRLTDLDGDDHQLHLPPGVYRVRYCGRDMDAANDLEQNYDADTVDSYVLQLWPAPAAPDRILRQTSRIAAYKHQAYRTVEPPADVLATEAADRDGDHEERVLRRFGGRIPNARLRNAFDHAWLALIDLDLTFAIAEADDQTHRRVAQWAALRALDGAHLLDRPELGPSIAALRRGEPALPPFTDERGMFTAFTTPLSDENVPYLPELRGAPDEKASRPWNAIGAVVATTDPDSLSAALRALIGAATSAGADQYRQLLTDLRQKFTQLGLSGDI